VENRHAEMLERVKKQGVIAVLAMVKPVRLIDHIVIRRVEQ
jgi:pantothenate synthetase